MSIVTLNNVTLGFSGPVLFDGINLQINPRDRIGLLGRNGVGKSTLLGIVEGSIKPDSGTCDKQPGLTIASLTQQVPQSTKGSIYAVVADGLATTGRLLLEYHEVITQLQTRSDDAILNKCHDLQNSLEQVGGWHFDQQINKVMSLFNLSPDVEFSSLSGGQKRQVLLARALVCEPDLLLLDEPTNHLDIEAILWLERFLVNYKGAVMLITHDRAFLQKVTNRIIELDRGNLADWPGDYQQFLVKKAAALETEKTDNALFDKKLAREEAWIREGIKARRTRNEGRVRALKQLRVERSQRREVLGQAKMVVQMDERSAKIVIEAENVFYSIDGKTIIRDFTTTIQRGEKIGIIGPNGCGKTTLINLLLGNLTPTQGTIKIGKQLQISYFDQLRRELVDEQTVQDNVGEGSDFITVNGKRKHVISYLEDFLFTPSRARSAVKVLSGGERNRVLLAKLFTKPSNFLVLDEPTNDLDLETLELLESLLVEFEGTLLVVSHDREFLNNIATSTIAYCGNGQFKEFVGGYDDCMKHLQMENTVEVEMKPQTKPQKIEIQTKKLTNQEKSESKKLIKKIEDLEQNQQSLQVALADPELYTSNPEAVAEIGKKLKIIEDELQVAYARWQELEERA